MQPGIQDQLPAAGMSIANQNPGRIFRKICQFATAKTDYNSVIINTLCNYFRLLIVNIDLNCSLPGDGTPVHAGRIKRHCCIAVLIQRYKTAITSCSRCFSDHGLSRFSHRKPPVLHQCRQIAGCYVPDKEPAHPVQEITAVLLLA